MNINKHFINTIEELQERIIKGTQYDLIKASGLLRQLLIDNPALIDKANEKHRIKILFKTNKQHKISNEKIVQDGVVWEPVISVFFIDPGDKEDKYTSELKKAQFLSYEVFNFNNHTFTIKDVIKIGANVLGGVHFDKPKTDRDEILSIANEMINYPDKVTGCAQAIKEIGTVVIKGVQPLLKTIKDNS